MNNKLPKKHLALFFMFLLIIPFQGAARKEKEKSLEPRVLTARDVLKINQVSTPRLSPDGKWVLYTQTTRDMEDKELKSITHIWKVSLDGSTRRQMTQGRASCTSPAWFPCGKKIAFLSSRGKGDILSEQESKERGEKNQIFLIYADGGEAWQVTEHKESIEAFEISPDGEKICFSSKDPLSEEEEKKRKEKDDAEVVDEKFRMSHLWLYDLASGKEERLTEGEFTVSDFRWSPDSREIVYVTRPNDKYDEAWNSDIWVVELETKKTRKVFENPGRDFNPRWSPDGKMIAFASEPHSGQNTWHNKLYLVKREGGEAKVLLKDFDLDFSNPIFSPDGGSIYWVTGERTTYNLFSVELKSGRIKKFEPPRGLNFQFELSADGKRWVFIHSPSSWPAEVYAADLELRNLLRLSDANPWLREEKVKLAKVEKISWKNSDGEEIEGVLTFPVDYDQNKKYPLILNPHGGPSGARVESFSAINHFFAGNGFMVLEPNFRGSTNYGQEFLNANRGYWGIRDYDDCMTGVDYCVKKGWADPEKLVCYGWSYGGYLSFWIVTQTDRFKAVSPGAGLSNLYSMYSTTDIPGYMKWFFGTPWDEEDLYRKLSPIRHVKNVKTPVLIMHGGNDARVPPTQAVEFYQALRDLGKDVTYVRYPREGHGIQEPRHQLDRLRRYLFFFCKHVGLPPVSEKEIEKEEVKEEKKN